ncbi:uncharacterized protein LOC8279198 isoform X2 [Ricinus communis]|uniref:Uncharacterized protein n=1 Tax=Ricinus communis TaxID=3988 RepID=B9RX60_RICCO|nr:uncharacterized protein LOC8279198 isoform X2 [Ricinus communis]EEF44089.1 conserved hypothetical protein [Ricinus communis]|eukprot:XP_002518329.1 uncharacterized protein LOC8279198 isoform X2 [Ricinus communis]
MALSLPRKWKNSIFFTSTLTPNLKVNGFRSKSALEAIAKAREEEKIQTLVLYNYPSFSGAFSALFAHLFHSNFNLPHLILPFSSVHPFSVQDFCFEGLERCYLFDFLGPPGFASMLSKKTMCQVLGFDHRKSLLSRISSIEECPENVTFHVDVEKSSSSVVYEYYSNRLIDMKSPNGAVARLLNPEDQDRVEMVLKYVEDVDIRRWSLPDIRAFSVGLSEWRSKLNCITNPFIFEELLEISSTSLIAKGNSYISSRQSAASKLLEKVFKVRLGRGLYGECLGVRADGNSNLSDEIGRQLSVKSAEAGLRPMGAVVYLQRNNLKMCLRSTDNATDTSEVAKAYGGGGSRSSSSFIIRMDEYNRWLSDSPS